MIRKIVLGLTVAAFACTGAALAQGIKRTPLQKIDFPAGYTTVTAIAEIPAGGSAGRHTHPGVETGYVIEGEGDLIIDGQPTKHLKPGENEVAFACECESDRIPECGPGANDERSHGL